jgi:uncharacterized protein YggE
MIQAVIQSKKMLIVLGAALVLLLAVACNSGSNGNGEPGAGGGVSTANLSDLLSAAGGAEGVARLLQSGSSTNTGIWVSGTGKASGEPDLGVLSLGVEALADTASEARGEAAGAIDQIITVLTRNSIEDRDMQTSQFSISPRYNTQEVTKCVDREPSGNVIPVPAPGEPARAPEVQGSQGTECRVEFERVLIGYQVTNTLTVKVRDLDNMGGIIDGVTDAAGDLTRINGVNFTIEDTKPLQAQAREEAIADMLAKANAMARLAGIELGNLVFLTETGGGMPPPIARFESAAAAGLAVQSTTILAGELDVRVNVQGVFNIAP